MLRMWGKLKKSGGSHQAKAYQSIPSDPEDQASPEILDVHGKTVYRTGEVTGSLPRKPEMLLRRPVRDLDGELDLNVFAALEKGLQKQVMCHLQYAEGIYGPAEIIDPEHKAGDYNKMMKFLEKSDRLRRRSPSA